MLLTVKGTTNVAAFFKSSDGHTDGNKMTSLLVVSSITEMELHEADVCI